MERELEEETHIPEEQAKRRKEVREIEERRREKEIIYQIKQNFWRSNDEEERRLNR